MKQRFIEILGTDSLDSESASNFVGVPPKVRIRTRFAEDNIFVDTSSNQWLHERYCAIDWRRCRLHPKIENAMRRFIWHRLASNSPSTANGNFNLLMSKQEVLEQYPFPWSAETCTAILGAFQSQRDVFLTFRIFYRWAALKKIAGFTREISSLLDDFAAPEYETYRSVKFRENVFSAAEESAFIAALDDAGDESNYFALRDNVMAHLNWELGLRAEQVAGVEERNLKEVQGPSGVRYFHLSLIRLKQRTYQSSYRNRVVSERLAKKIQQLILLKEEHFGQQPGERPIFVDVRNRRVSPGMVRNAIVQICEKAQLDSCSSTFLRHNMAQKLADQGTPGDLISDMLDHTTKVAARHYVAATPAIAKIKARALGKNATYKELMSLMTGALIHRKEADDPTKIVRGMVATRYIGNIGTCGLETDTACAKNPIYSCYTCRKFQPFIDGEHGNVVAALRSEVQLMLDQSLDLGENKVVLQLEKTIEHASDILARCEAHGRGTL
ncbi:site-specific integrase [Rugamonas sp. A1-17]|nr:site-specific integrase [Rugamonas sp. A1-17]